MAVWEDMPKFRRNFDGVVVAANHALDRFEVDNPANTIGAYDSDFKRTRVLVLKLIALGAEVSHSLHDGLDQLRSTSELAFQHLQHLIVVDTEFRHRWVDAFRAGESHCEKIGAAHLLSRSAARARWHGGG